MIRRIPLLLSVCLFGLFGAAQAQQSASYKLEENVFNSGGHPADGLTLASAGFRLTLDALGEGVSARNLGSPSHVMDTCFVATYAPPGEVANLRLGDAVMLRWDAERSAGRYNLYRALLSTLPGLGYGSCLQSEIFGETASDTAVPGTDQGFFYLVTVENRIEEEGTKGFDSSRIERSNTAPCLP